MKNKIIVTLSRERSTYTIEHYATSCNLLEEQNMHFTMQTLLEKKQQQQILTLDAEEVIDNMQTTKQK